MRERRGRVRAGREVGLTALGLALLFIVLSVAVMSGYQGIDQAFAPAPDPAGDRLAHLVERIARPTVSIGAGIVLALLLVAWGRRQAALLLGLAVGLAGATGAVAKLLISRDRPPGADVGALDLAASFPSGHVTMATAMLLGFAFAVTAPGSTARRVGVVLAVLLAGLVGFGRVAGGDHFPSDVLGGLLLGAAIVCLAEWLLGARWHVSPPVLTRWLQQPP